MRVAKTPTALSKIKFLGRGGSVEDGNHNQNGVCPEARNHLEKLANELRQEM
jgi:hypothetical protein